MAEENGKSEFQHTETTSRSKAGAGHCKKFWWVYLLVLIVIIVIVIPCIILVAVPKIAQQKIDASTLQVDGIIISKSETNTLNMAINSSITTDGSSHGTIAAFNATMYLLDYDPVFEFATIEFPATDIAALVLVNVSQTLTIEHMTELTIFNTQLLTKESVRVQIKGDTTVRVSGIARDYPVTFDKTVEFTGFNSFAGLAIDDAHVKLTSENNFNATATIPNPTIWTIDAGDVSFFTFFNESVVGITDVYNMVLAPGNNSFPVNGTVDQGTILGALASKPYCTNGGILPFQITGYTVTNDGQSIPWLADALSSYNDTVNIDIGSAVKSDLGLTIQCVNTTTTSNSTTSS